VQYEILKLLQSVHNNLFVVGDDDQSIYGWRGAEVKNILEFQATFSDAQIFRLEQNYRSTKKILNVANAIISKNTARMGKELWTENGEGVKIETFTAYDEGEEAFYVTQQIQNLIRYSNCEHSDFAVLMRVNALSRSFEQEFTKYGIPFKVFGGFKFFERKEIKDLLAYLSALVNHADNEAVLRIINVPKRGIGDKTVEKLADIAVSNRLSVMQLLLQDDLLRINFNAGTVNKLMSFRELLNDLFDYKKSHDPVSFVRHLISRTGYRQSLEQETDENRLMNLDEFVASADEFFKKNPDADIADFIESVTLSADRDTDVVGNEFVTLATVHAAKGLEFKVVFVVGLDDTVFPVSRAMYDTAQMEEERRLMYVAVTRPKERLYLTRCKCRFLYGERRFMLPSVFFKDADSVINVKTGDALIQSTIDLSPVNKGGNAVDLTRFQPGAKVRHKVFGEGIVLTKSGENADVSFKGIGIKTLALRFAPLEIID
jgi:DNA helicase-2/ATP-dependent DNA helicase PcrA